MRMIWTRDEAGKFVAISNKWQDLEPYPAVSLREEEEDVPYLSASARLVIRILSGRSSENVRRK